MKQAALDPRELGRLYIKFEELFNTVSTFRTKTFVMKRSTEIIIKRDLEEPYLSFSRERLYL